MAPKMEGQRRDRLHGLHRRQTNDSKHATGFRSLERNPRGNRIRPSRWQPWFLEIVAKFRREGPGVLPELPWEG